jgi:integrase
MPRPAKGPRLWLQPARRDSKGQATEPAVWCIRDDNNKKLSTGIPDSENGRPPQAAIEALTEYLNLRKTPRIKDRDPSQILISDVIDIYDNDKGINHARPADTRARLLRIAKFFNGKTLSDLNKGTCAAYVTHRGKQAAARRELEDLRAAVRHHWELGLCSALTPVVLPDKGEARERWLTRQEAAKLLWTAWRLREDRGDAIGRLRAKHLAHFILVGLYTGTRSGAICGAALEPTEGRGWVDLERGVFYRRAIGKKKTNKRQPSIRVPPRLLAHIRRWKAKRLISHSLIEWHGDAIKRVSKGFTSLVRAANLKDVSPHILRHTAITWQAQLGVPPHEICGFFGITMKMFEEVYGHHHPDFQSNAVNALNRSRPTRQPAGNVAPITKVG